MKEEKPEITDIPIPPKKNEEPEEKAKIEEKKELGKTSKESKQKKVYKIPKIIGLISLWLIAAFIGVWIKTNVTFNVDNSIAITTASLSIMANFIVLGGVFATGIGQKVIKRFKNRILFHTGRYVNTIHLTKNGTAKEVFKKVDSDTKTFLVMGQKFIRNPKLLFNFEKIPTYLHREGNPDPINIWDDKIASQLSNAEMDIAMTSAQNFDLKQWINQHKQIIFIAAIIIVGLGALSAYMGFSTFQMMRDGTYKAVECLIPPNFITPGV